MGKPVRVVLGWVQGAHLTFTFFFSIFSRRHGWQSLSVSKCKSRRVDFVFCSTQAVGKPVRVVLRGVQGAHLTFFPPIFTRRHGVAEPFCFKRQIESSRFCVLLDTSCVLDRACSRWGGSRALASPFRLRGIRTSVSTLFDRI